MGPACEYAMHITSPVLVAKTHSKTGPVSEIFRSAAVLSEIDISSFCRLCKPRLCIRPNSIREGNAPIEKSDLGTTLPLHIGVLLLGQLIFSELCVRADGQSALVCLVIVEAENSSSTSKSARPTYTRFVVCWISECNAFEISCISE